jgi:hypothetical protein
MFDSIISFRNFLLTEDNKVLKQTASDIAERLQSMLDLVSTGVVELKGDCDDIFSLIQTMLHGNWLKQQQSFLVPLQTVAYNIKLLSDGDKEAKSQDVAGILKGCLDLITQQILDKIKGPVNDLAVMDKQAPEAEPIGSDQPMSKVGGTNFDNQTEMPYSGTDLGEQPPLGMPTDMERPNS